MLVTLLILGTYVAMVVLCLWLQAVHYKMEDMAFEGFNVVFAFIPLSFFAPLIYIVASLLDSGEHGIATTIQKILTPK